MAFSARRRPIIGRVTLMWRVAKVQVDRDGDDEDGAV
uniref:Uncharacterized protein n=1 Tax=Arundo donax TaxID=35708 RepID=A0A0A9BWV0_ARUDO